MFVSGVYLLIQFRKQPWDETSVLVIALCPSHRESLACSGLSVAKNAPRIPVKSTGEDLFSTKVVDDLLGAVHKYFLELESPLVLGVVDDALVQGFLYVNVYRAELSFENYPVCSSMLSC